MGEFDHPFFRALRAAKNEHGARAARRQLSFLPGCRALYALCCGLNCFQFKKFRGLRLGK